MHPFDQEKRSYHSGSDDEAALPLYNTAEDATKPPIPDKTASPAEVRGFITRLLIATRSLTETHAREIADKWILGTGDELLETYPAQMYREIFGSESGWMVYKEVMLHKYETAHPQRNQRSSGCVGLVISTLIFVAVILLGRLAVNREAWVALYPVIIVGLFDALAVLVCFGMAVAPKTSALKLVEGKLKDSFFKAPQAGSLN